MTTAQSIVSAQDIQNLIFRQYVISEEIFNLEIDDYEEYEEAQSNYFSNINVLYSELGEDTPCKTIDPLTFRRLTNKLGKENVDEKLSRRQVMVLLGDLH